MAWLRRVILWSLDACFGRWLRRRRNRDELGGYYHAILDLIRDGDIIVCRRRWTFSNLFIPGYWKHAAMYVGLRTTVEALGSGVQRTSLGELLDRVDEIAIVRSRSVDAAEGQYAAAAIQSLVGARYDLEFAWGNDAFYCSEACVWALLQAEPLLGFRRRSIMGVETILPNDFYEADEHFVVLFDSRSW